MRLLLPLLLFTRLAVAFDFTTCCEKARAENAFVSPVPAPDNQTCAQVYNADTPAALPLYVRYSYCRSECGGMGLSKTSAPNEWAAPLVQFILPSVIFSMSVPRRKKIEFDYVFDWEREWWRGHNHFNDFLQLARSLVIFTLLLIPVTIDTIIWISVIMVGAGNMLIGALYEAHLDYRVVKYVKGMDVDKLTWKRELLVTVACGNLQLGKESGSPQETIPRSISLPGPDAPTDGEEKGRSRLLNLLGAQSDFGGAVGSPVLFFLGAFVYTILDIMNNRSSEDAAISLGFGIEWMIIVHVAIMSGCLLAANNPSTSSGIVGSPHEALEHPVTASRTWTAILRPGDPGYRVKDEGAWERFSRKFLGWNNTYDTKFQPVSLWSRGTNKMQWIRRSAAYREDKAFRKQLEFTTWGWFFKIFIPTMSLIVLPPATGGVVAYFTPPRGLGCRSLSFIVYAGCQIIVTLIALISNAVDDGEEDRSKDSRAKRQFTGRHFIALSVVFWFFSLLAAVGGATMQVIGVYRNCVCYAGAVNWHALLRINPSVNLASDTQAQRDSSGYWIYMGITATAFMAVNCYVGWWYQRLIRHRFIDAVKSMYTPPHPTWATTPPPPPHDVHAPPTPSPPPSAHRLSGEEPLLAQDGASIWSSEAQSVFSNTDRLESTARHIAHDSLSSGSGSGSSGIPVILLSDEEHREGIELLPSRRVPRPRAYS